MCIFTNEIASVNSTRIFARLESGFQAIVYDMYLSTDSQTAMVLPIPITHDAGEDSVRFVDLSNYEGFFDDLEELFPKSRFFANALGLEEEEDRLEVVEVGVFEASFVPSKTAFNRLDQRFRMGETLFQRFPQYDDYGFIVFKLKPGESKVHPMAFWFQTRDERQLFFPTVHMHDSELHEYADFSHDLFAQGEVIKDSGMVCTGVDAKGRIAAISRQSDNLVAIDSEVYRLPLFGSLLNRDTWFTLRT